MDIFICDSCGNEFNIENEGTVKCPVCGTHHTVTLRKKKEEEAPSDALSDGSENEGFSLSRLRSSIIESYEADMEKYPAQTEENKNTPPVAAPVEKKQKKEKKEKKVKEPRPVSPEKQARIDKKNAKKQKKRDKKQAKEDKRNAKISRQINRNTNKLMFVVCLVLIAICCGLGFMYKNNLTFFDLPAVINGANGNEKTTIAVNINEQIPGMPAEPPAGAYIVTADAGVGVYSAASDNSDYLDAMTKDTILDVKAFKYDAESQQYWGRIKIDNTYGWVPMNGLQQSSVVPATEVPTTAVVHAIG
ncbi:MAG: hypothetical protein IJO14_10595 [Clostridia bacterium]|nr:hypothetical protein [Clostridia bacterium]